MPGLPSAGSSQSTDFFSDICRSATFDACAACRRLHVVNVSNVLPLSSAITDFSVSALPISVGIWALVVRVCWAAK